jgi:hypothetical protein
MAKKPRPKHPPPPLILPVKSARYTAVFVQRIKQGQVAGLCDDDDRMIFIAMTEEPRNRLAVIFHEWLHAVEAEYGVQLGHGRINQLEWDMVSLFEILSERHSDGTL